MKTQLYYLLVLFLVAAISASAKTKDGQVLSGNTLTDLGSYTITKADDPMIVNNQVLETYELMYENASNPIKIGILYDKNCTKFLVRSEEVEVQYESEDGNFGVRKMEKKYRELEEVTSDSKMSRADYLSQRVITQNKKSGKELLGLIACYFPVLVEKQYQAQL